jgi:hypothetical protein
LHREASDTPRMIEHPVPIYLLVSSLLAGALSRSFAEGGSSDTGGIFGDGVDRLWMHRHDFVLQEAGLFGLPPGVCSVAEE